MPCESDKSHPNQDYCEVCSSCHACTDEYISELQQKLADLKASLPKVRADAVVYAISECIHNGADGQGWQSDLEQCAIQLEVGNE